jgi:hypothetical protein
MKLIPTLERNTDATILVSIDDDVILGPAMIPMYKDFFSQQGPCIASRQVQTMPGDSSISYILGVNVIALHRQLITSEFIKDLKAFNQLSACR